MVGTLEPRKGYKDIIEAFELLWGTGENARLIIVGKHGWMVDDLVSAINNSKYKNTVTVTYDDP